jgi:NitT/TauT family transport system ATP-binding protein
MSAAPGSIVDDIRIDLPADRDQITTRGSAEFVAARAAIGRLLHHRDAPTAKEYRWTGT